MASLQLPLLALSLLLGSGATYVNPVLSNNAILADPGVIRHQGTYYLYPTGDRTSYDVYTSQDLVTWTQGPEVFVPGGNNVFAPDVFRDPVDGRFYLYYSAGFQLGVAVADTPLGPFEDLGILLESALDAHMVRTGGSYYLYHARLRPDGADIYVQPMLDPVSPDGAPILLLTPDQAWEFSAFGQSIVEAPWMLEINGAYYLMYSGNNTRSTRYAIGYATASHPLGPFQKHPDNPITFGPPFVWGAGHHAVVGGPDGLPWVIYHQKKNPQPSPLRFICIDRLFIDAQGALHIGTTRGIPMPAPAGTID